MMHMDDPHRRLDELKTTMVRAHAASDVEALRLAVTEAWILSRALKREADVDAVFELIDIRVTEDDKGMPTFLTDLSVDPAER
jgi:hypothetical protein